MAFHITALWILTTLLVITALAHGAKREDRDLLVTCTSVARKQVVEKSTDIFASSVANAVAVGCSCADAWTGGRNAWGVPTGSCTTSKCVAASRKKLNKGECRGKYKPKRVYRKMKASFKAWGRAYAKAVVYTQLLCMSDGNSTGIECQASTQDAEAVAQARAEFVATAAAAAFTRCKACNLTVEAQAILSASLLLELTAKANARVDTQVCVGPNSTASAEGFVKCYGNVVARGITKAIAKAMISGNCFAGLQAQVEVEAEVKADTKELCACTGWVTVVADGELSTAQANISGSCDAYVEQLPTPVPVGTS